jgi:fatty acid-binding protein DegV
VLFGRRNAGSRFARLVRRRIHDDVGYRVAVGHANAQAEGQALLAEICEGLDNIHARFLMPLGTALGVHGGPGMLVVGLQEYESPLTPALSGKRERENATSALAPAEE